MLTDEDRAAKLLERLFCAVLNEWAYEGQPWDWEPWTPLWKAEAFLRSKGRRLAASCPASFINIADDKSAYKHDCDHCVYLGGFYHRKGKAGEGTHYDLYFHPGDEASAATLARHGDEPEDNVSWLVRGAEEAMPWHAEAKRRAKERGLIP
jgi:hypothetical protein